MRIGNLLNYSQLSCGLPLELFLIRLTSCENQACNLSRSL